jgi:hypothetical protein
MKPLSNYCEDGVRKWLRSHPGRAVTVFQIVFLCSAAYFQVAAMLIATSGFHRTGVWPVDMNVFTEAYFFQLHN